LLLAQDTGSERRLQRGLNEPYGLDVTFERGQVVLDLVQSPLDAAS